MCTATISSVGDSDISGHDREVVDFTGLVVISSNKFITGSVCLESLRLSVVIGH